MSADILEGTLVDPRAARCADLAQVAQESGRASFDAWLALGGELLAQRQQMPADRDFGEWLAAANHFGVRHKQNLSYAMNAAWYIGFTGVKPDDAYDVGGIRALDKLARAKKKELARPAPTPIEGPTQPDLRVGDFRIVLNDITPDAIITDPPYPAEYLPLYADLAAWADNVLPDHGLLAVMVGQSYLPQLFTLLDGHRPYRWTLAYLTPGGQATQLWDRNVNTFWKPILIYGHTTKATRWVGDVARSHVNDNDKDHHHWGQSVSGMVDLVERLTEPGQLIADPFMGAGTTGVAAHATGRRFVGADIDPEHVTTTQARIR